MLGSSDLTLGSSDITLGSSDITLGRSDITLGYMNILSLVILLIAYSPGLSAHASLLNL